ncbi:hypothetical protein F0U62_25870 [Cystobacter fuscus]|uniref:hypothetical protein n=1 Tax=Cystobacter fuscus TaxID=43 RepID=UPI002B306B82|nr:hypothetical protein F0U62_25870 [Cystobacter fuscus]
MLNEDQVRQQFNNFERGAPSGRDTGVDQELPRMTQRSVVAERWLSKKNRSVTAPVAPIEFSASPPQF